MRTVRAGIQDGSTFSLVNEVGVSLDVTLLDRVREAHLGPSGNGQEGVV